MDSLHQFASVVSAVSVVLSVADSIRAVRPGRTLERDRAQKIFRRPRFAGPANIITLDVFYWGIELMNIQIPFLPSNPMIRFALLVGITLLALRTGFRWNREFLILGSEELTFLGPKVTKKIRLSDIRDVKVERYAVTIVSSGKRKNKLYPRRLTLEVPWSRYGELKSSLLGLVPTDPAPSQGPH